MRHFSKFLSAGLAAVAMSVSAGALAGPFDATDSTFQSFDASSGTRALNITGFGAVTGVNLTIVFAKCDDPSVGAGATLGSPCIGTGFSFDREIVFALTHLGTTVNLVNQDTYSGSTPGAGVVLITFDDLGGALGAGVAGGTFHGVQNLAAFNGLEANGLWTLSISDTVGADRLDYFRSCLAVNGGGGICTAVVPEPMPLALLAIGLVGFGLTRRRR